jgi:hypothetical protein
MDQGGEWEFGEGFVFWVAFLSFPIVVLVSAGVLVEAETRLVEDPPSVGT